MKKVSWAITGVMMLILLCGCASSPKDRDSVLVARGEAMVQRLSTMADSEEYQAIMGLPSETSDQISEIASGDYSAPRAVYAIDFSDGALTLLLEEAGIHALPDEIRQEMARRLFAAAPTQINGMGGAKILMATSVLSLQECFVQQGFESPLLYLYLYDGDWSVAVTFLPGDDGAVQAAATFLYDSSLKAISSEEQMNSWLSTQYSLMGSKAHRIQPGA